MKLGAQLYTVRDFCKDLDGFSETLKKIADIGYETVQVSGVCKYEAAWLKEELSKSGLKCVITHTSPDEMKNDIGAVIENHNIFNCENIGLGFYGFSQENCLAEYNEFLKTYLPIAEAIKNGGKYFMYHNHAAEFIKISGKRIIDKLIEEFSPDSMGIILDTYWVQVGGCNPADYLEKLVDRAPVIHLKDYSFGGKMAVVGEGNLNFDKILDKAEKAHTKYLMVEQDECYGESPFDCLKRSYNNLKLMGV